MTEPELPTTPANPDPTDRDEAPAPKPHDALLREVFRRKEDARAVFRAILPERLLLQLDLDTLEPDHDRFVDDSLRARFADLVFRVRTHAGSDVRLHLLLEHYRRAVPALPLVVLGYSVRALEDLHRRAKPGESLPALVAVVLHQGDRPYRGPRAVADLLDPRHDDNARRSTPEIDILHVDLAELSDDTLIQIAKAAAFPAAALFLMKNVAHPKLAELLRQRRDFFVRFAARTPRQLVRLLLSYVALAARDRNAPPALLEVLPVNVEDPDDYYTLADELRAEGRKLGRQQGREEGREQGLQQGLERGRAEGSADTRHRDILRILRTRFGDLPREIEARIVDLADPDLLADLVIQAAIADDLGAFRNALHG